MSALLKSDRKLNCSVGVSRSVLCLFITEVRVLERKTPRRKVRTTSWRLVFIHRFEYSTTKLGGGKAGGKRRHSDKLRSAFLLKKLLSYLLLMLRTGSNYLHRQVHLFRGTGRELELLTLNQILFS